MSRTCGFLFEILPAMILPSFVSSTSIIGAFILLGVVHGQYQRNITIDDTDPTIVYTGSWYTETSEADSYGNGHHYSSQSTAYAKWNFTGVAVYYLMPLFEGFTGGVSTLITLDAGPAQFVNLTRAGSEPTTTDVRWSATGLSNTTHTVMISLGRSAKGDLADWGEVDALIYTVEDPTPPSNTPTSTAAAPASTALVALEKCPPCGKSKCTFSPQGSPSYDSYALIVGKPVANCDAGNNQTVTTQYSTSMQVSETWSIDTTIGIDFEGVKVEATTGWSNTQSFTAGQVVTMTIPPGKMAALTAHVSYKKTSGDIKVDSDSFSFSSIQPSAVQNYSVEYADCGGLFNAFTFSSNNCTSTSAAYTNRVSFVFVGLVGIMVLWSMI